MVSSALTGGPTIMDLNSGFLRDDRGLVNIYEEHRGFPSLNFTKEEFGMYGAIFDRVKRKIMEVHGLDALWFTAPTFVTRLVGNATWRPKSAHDMYWMPHVDKENTEYYDYSGLIYLSTHGKDFEGGEFKFYDGDDETDPGVRAITVLPRAGRLITFTSGQENYHQVQPVRTGVRYTFSMWFTCSSSRHFNTFLDGKRHDKFSH